MAAAAYERTFDWYVTGEVGGHRGGYRVLHPECVRPLEQPQFLDPITSASPLVAEAFKGRQTRTRETFVATMRRACVYGPNGAVSAPDGGVLADVTYDLGKAPGDSPLLLTDRTKFVPLTADNVAVIASAGGGYFHWMLGMLPRLLLLIEAGVDLHAIDLFLVKHASPTPAFITDTLALFGIPDGKTHCLRFNECCSCGCLWLTSLPWYKHSLPDWVREGLRKLFLGSLPPPPRGRRIYVSRCNANSRRVVNEEELLEYLVPLGFEKLVPDELSVCEQARIFSEAAVILAPHGAGLTNIIFCGAGTRIIELFAASHVNSCYWIVANCVDATYTCMLTEPAGATAQPKRADLRVDTARLAHILGPLLDSPVLA